jgi:hypothetical protein
VGLSSRLAAFAVANLDRGTATEALSGEVQASFDGNKQIDCFDVAWLEHCLLFGTGSDCTVIGKLAAKYQSELSQAGRWSGRDLGQVMTVGAEGEVAQTLPRLTQT